MASIPSCSLKVRIAVLEVELENERREHATALAGACERVRHVEAAYARLAAQHAELEDAHASVVLERDQLLRRFLGRKSEKERSGVSADGQQELAFPQPEAQAGPPGPGPAQSDQEPAAEPQGADQALGGESQAGEGGAAPAPEKKKEKRRGKGGRKKLPEKLDRVPEVILPPEHLRVCACGKHKVQIGEESSEKLERVPSTLYVRVTIRPILACPDGCEAAVVCAPAPPSRIEHGLAGESVHGWLLASKFGDHLPLNRLSGILAREGCRVAPSTLDDWVQRDAFDLSPIYRVLRDDVVAGSLVRTDDTSIRVLDPAVEGGVRSGRIWAYLGPERGDLFFSYSATKENADEESCHVVLASFRGTVQADASNGYDALFHDGTRCEAGCWCHCRRKFRDALKNGFPEAKRAIEVIRDLYKIEREAKLDRLDAEARRALRQAKSRPIVDAFFEWVKLAAARVVPKTLLAQALGYAKNQEKALRAFLEDGRLEMDNNDTERALRQVAVGRRAWLFAGSAQAARNACVLLTLVYTCKELGIDPVAYLTDVLSRVRAHPASRVRELTPRAWLEARQAAEAAASAQ